MARFIIQPTYFMYAHEILATLRKRGLIDEGYITDDRVIALEQSNPRLIAALEEFAMKDKNSPIPHVQSLRRLLPNDPTPSQPQRPTTGPMMRFWHFLRRPTHNPI